MTDEANLSYAAQPDRLFVVNDGKVVYVGFPGPFGYDVKGLEKWIKEYFD